RVVAAGGYDPNIAFWDESPGSQTFCPTPGSERECGSNYTNNFGEPPQELVAAAKSVFSTIYPGKDWAPTLECGDSFGTPSGDGLGLCTGTSMSAPQISGVVGILRSINPLATTSKPVLGFGDVAGIRSVLAQTTFEAQIAQGWTPTFGHGRVDAAAAARRMLGTVQGRTVKNRVTPLFRLYGANAKDYADTTSPQFAIAIAINQAGAYQTQGSLIPGYDEFPPDPGAETPLPTPRAAIYVLTTEYKPRPEWPALVPLYQMDRSRNYPIGCTPPTPGCNTKNRDYILVTTTAHIEQAYADGYKLRTIQGYIYQPCTVEPACIPPGTEKMYRACKTADDDCATFLESERTTFEAAGYTAAYPSGSNKVLGYAYPYADNDPPRFPGGPVGDGLVDGFEWVIGTKIDSWDSDGDGDGDVEEFPMVGVAVSDPCSGLGGYSCPADVIFKNGFQ
ncbi:S8 family serine peptidase, partial [Dokdonella sp.]|uniref:S8 family serine peptidase n=1 Tax=Dokdonella sp. TaxID=2291710 RepID=UPI0025BB68ED